MDVKKKEINRFFSKGTSNVYLKVTIETFSKLWFFGFQKFCHQVSFWGAPTEANMAEF